MIKPPISLTDIILTVVAIVLASVLAAGLGLCLADVFNRISTAVGG